MKQIFIVFTLLILLQQNLLSQEKDRKFYVIGLALPNRTPENGFNVQGGIMGLFRMDNDSTLRKSNIYAFGMYSEFHQYKITQGATLIFPKDKYYIFYETYYSYNPDKYFGFQDNASTENSEFIVYNNVFFNAITLKRLSSRYLFGLYWGYENVYNLEYDTNGYFVNDKDKFTMEGQIFTIGPAIRQDNRDDVIWATSGAKHNIQLTYNQPLDDYLPTGFIKYTFDFRWYFRIRNNKTQTLGLQAYSENIAGEASFRQTPSLNTRAFHPNLYRYNHVNWVRADYKFQLPLRWLFANGFIEPGMITNDYQGLSNDNLRTSYGAGLHFLISKANWLFFRIEYARAVEVSSSNIHVAFDAAF